MSPSSGPSQRAPQCLPGLCLQVLPKWGLGCGWHFQGLGERKTNRWKFLALCINTQPAMSSHLSTPQQSLGSEARGRSAAVLGGPEAQQGGCCVCRGQRGHPETRLLSRVATTIHSLQEESGESNLTPGR